MRRLATMVALAIVACRAEPHGESGAAGRPCAGARAQPRAAAPDPAGEDDPPPLTPEATARVAALTGALSTGACVPEATRELRALQRVHGDPEPLREALALALAACEDLSAAAELLARTLPPNASVHERLRLGAAWIRATRYAEAADVLEPLAASEGPTSKAAWLAGFALFHAGRAQEAGGLLESARAQAPTDRPDAWLLIGLVKLHAGDVVGATAELEAGTHAVPDSPSLWSALARAYQAAGRPDDAAHASARALQSHAAREQLERASMRLAARGSTLNAAAKSGDVVEVERVFDAMWPDAPPKVRIQLLEIRASVRDEAGRTDDAASDRARARALSEESSP